jgi:hypothetical protein
MQPYLYAAGNPLRYTDPSGEIIPFLIAAGLGGLIAGGLDLGTQLLAMHPQSLSQALRCVNWGQVGIAFVGGAVAGLTGFTIFGAATALLGTGFFANLAAGFLSGWKRVRKKAPLPHMWERGWGEGRAYSCPQPFEKVLNFALISRNRLH